jgi:glycosyltransferase involved in cell wall biosynthesis
VVIGSYNAAAWIRPAIESVLAQTYPVAEVIVVDDGSTDETAAIIRSFGAPILLVQETHRGRPYRNRGIEASSGGLVALIDADDLWRPDKLHRQIVRMRERKAEWIACDADWMDSETGKPAPTVERPPIEGDILTTLFLHNFIVASTAVVSRRALDEVGGFDESPDIAPMEDWDLWLRIAARYPLAIVQERLATVRLHHDSFLASTPLARRVQSLENVITRAAAREPARLESQRSMALHNAYFGAGVSSFRHGLRSEARGYFIRAWRQAPGNMAALAYVGLTFASPSLLAFALSLKGRSVEKR